jgi:hypothetical protein
MMRTGILVYDGGEPLNHCSHLPGCLQFASTVASCAGCVAVQLQETSMEHETSEVRNAQANSNSSIHLVDENTAQLLITQSVPTPDVVSVPHSAPVFPPLVIGSGRVRQLRAPVGGGRVYGLHSCGEKMDAL